MKILANRLYGLLVFPLATFYWLLMRSNARRLVMADLRQWSRWRHTACNLWGFSYLLGSYPEFRSVFYKRVGVLRLLSSWWLRGKNTLEITTNDIGGGLIIQHGFSTIISAERIGKNCKIYQQVTIGFDHDAKVIGGITVGDNVLIGANAVVVKDVPSNSIVAGVPARIIRHLDHMRDLTL